MTTVGDFLVRRLLAWGVKRIYGYPGDGINGIIGALHRAEDQLEFIQVRHEEQAAFMATAHAKFTGELGVCLGTSGPGAIHLLNGLYDAKADHVPVLALCGQIAMTAMGSEYQQEVDLQSLFKDVAGEYVVTVMHPAQVRHTIDRAVRGALGSHGVTALIFPKDLQDQKAVETIPHRMNLNNSGARRCSTPGRRSRCSSALVRMAQPMRSSPSRMRCKRDARKRCLEKRYFRTICRG